MSQSQTITVSLLDNYNSSFRIATTWKNVKIAIFTTFYGNKWHWMTTASIDFWHKYVSESNQYCLIVCHLLQLFSNSNNLKNCENGHFYGILRQKMTLNDDSFTWFLAWICLRVKPILFDHMPPLTAVFNQQSEKTIKMAIFMAFYGKKWHWMTTASLDFWWEYIPETNY